MFAKKILVYFGFTLRLYLWWLQAMHALAICDRALILLFSIKWNFASPCLNPRIAIISSLCASLRVMYQSNPSHSVFHKIPRSSFCIFVGQAEGFNVSRPRTASDEFDAMNRYADSANNTMSRLDSISISPVWNTASQHAPFYWWSTHIGTPSELSSSKQ